MNLIPKSHPGDVRATAPDRDGDDCLDVIVIGAGQAGLCLAWHLAQRGRRFLVVDAAAELGHTWRSRWDSLRLFSPAQYDSLPGMEFPRPTTPTRPRTRSLTTSPRTPLASHSRFSSAPQSPARAAC
jgi:cation diffusion facilitator CzcD-associated flavoprotein CzcO